MWQQLFGWTNVVALVGWALLILGPRRWLSLPRYGAVGLLCATYVVLLVALVTGWVDPGRDHPAPPFEYTVAGLRAMFASDSAVVVGWTHYLAFDLFVGCWIAEAASARGVSRWIQPPVLLLTFMAGPAGLLAWYLFSLSPSGERDRRAGGAAKGEGK